MTSLVVKYADELSESLTTLEVSAIYRTDKDIDGTIIEVHRAPLDGAEETDLNTGPVLEVVLSATEMRAIAEFLTVTADATERYHRENLVIEQTREGLSYFAKLLGQN